MSGPAPADFDRPDAPPDGPSAEAASSSDPARAAALARARRVDQACDELEQRLSRGERPALEEFLPPDEDTTRARLLRELLAIEISHRLALGEQPLASDYRARFPAQGELIEALLSQHETHVGRRSEGDTNGPLQEHLRALLDEASPLGRLPPAVRDEVLSRGRQRIFAGGERLLTQGEPAEDLLVVLEGAARVTVEASGDKRAIACAGPGAILGEMSLTTRGPCLATVTALGEVRCLAIPAAEVFELQRRRPALEALFHELMTERFARSSCDALSGKELAGYRVVQCVGRGGMGAVYEAQRLADGHRVALKMMSHRWLLTPDAVERFEREAEIGRRLRHPHIVRAYETIRGLGTCFLVLDFVEGPSLEQRIADKGPVTGTDLCRLTAQLAGALAHVHIQGIVHRDIKPANVLLEQGRNVRLTDFGLSRLPQAPGLTSAMTLLGTPHYMAPELLLGDPATSQSDIFALGATLLEAVLGRRAKMPSALRRLRRPTLEEADNFRCELDGVSDPELRRLLEAALQPDPLQRLSGVAEFLVWAQRGMGS